MQYKVILRQFFYNCFESTDVTQETKYVRAYREIQLPFVPFVGLALSLGENLDWVSINRVTWIERDECFECLCNNEYFQGGFDDAIKDKVSELWSVSNVLGGE